MINFLLKLKLEMSVQSRRIALLCGCLSLTLLSIGYLFVMIALPECTFGFYNIAFVINIGIISILGTIYFAKLIVIGDSCCKWLGVLGILLAIGGIVGLIFTNHNIISDYGIGFHNRCQILTTVYLFGALGFLVGIILLTTLCSLLSSPTYSEV